jgi:hypothetical protein
MEITDQYQFIVDTLFPGLGYAITEHNVQTLYFYHYISHEAKRDSSAGDMIDYYRHYQLIDIEERIRMLYNKIYICADNPRSWK